MACWLKAIFGGQGGHRINAATLLVAARLMENIATFEIIVNMSALENIRRRRVRTVPGNVRQPRTPLRPARRKMTPMPPHVPDDASTLINELAEPVPRSLRDKFFAHVRALLRATKSSPRPGSSRFVRRFRSNC